MGLIDPPSALTIVQDEQTIRIATRSAGRPRGPSSGTYRTVDGLVSPVPGDRSGVEWSWKDGTLVIAFEGGRMIAGAVWQEVWSLDPRGRLVVAITARRPNRPPTTTRFVYRRSR